MLLCLATNIIKNHQLHSLTHNTYLENIEKKKLGKYRYGLNREQQISYLSDHKQNK